MKSWYLPEIWQGISQKKKVAFEIEGEKSFFQNLIQPKKEILKERKTEKRQNSYEALMWILVITGIAVIGIRYKKNSQTGRMPGNCFTQFPARIMKKFIQIVC